MFLIRLFRACGMLTFSSDPAFFAFSVTASFGGEEYDQEKDDRNDTVDQECFLPCGRIISEIFNKWKSCCVYDHTAAKCEYHFGNIQIAALGLVLGHKSCKGTEWQVDRCVYNSYCQVVSEERIDDFTCGSKSGAVNMRTSDTANGMHHHRSQGLALPCLLWIFSIREPTIRSLTPSRRRETRRMVPTTPAPSPATFVRK